jgi:hypothetical protein
MLRRTGIGGFFVFVVSAGSACAVSVQDIGADRSASGGGSSGFVGGGATGGSSASAGTHPSGGAGATGGTTGSTEPPDSGGTGGSGGSSGSLGSGGFGGLDAGTDAEPDSGSPGAVIQVVCGPCPVGYTTMNGLIDAPKNDVCKPGAACGESWQNLCVLSGHQAFFGCSPLCASPWVLAASVDNCDGYCPSGKYEVCTAP